MRPLSRGDVRLASNDPNDAPVIDPNYMADPIDMKKMIACVRIGREIMESNAFKPHVSEAYAPLANIKTDQEILEYVRTGPSSTMPSQYQQTYLAFARARRRTDLLRLR
jgi:choline dehydrogenase